eukprot:403340745
MTTNSNKIVQKSFFKKKYWQKTNWGTIEICDGHLDFFPESMQMTADQHISFITAEKDYMYLTQRNLKEKNQQKLRVSTIQWIYSDKKYRCAYALNNRLVVFRVKNKYPINFQLTLPEKPQLIKLNDYEFLLWFRNKHELQIFNIKTLSIEQKILLKTNMGYQQIQKVNGKDNSTKDQLFELHFRSAKVHEFFTLNLQKYPYLFINQSIKIDQSYNSGGYITQSLANQRYIWNIVGTQGVYMKPQFQIICRDTLDQLNYNMSTNDQVIILNQKFETDRPPLLLILRDYQLKLLLDYSQIENLNGEIFQVFNKSNPSEQYASPTVSLIYEELRDSFVIFIIRKKPDNKGSIWKLKIPHRFIKRILENMKFPFEENDKKSDLNQNIKSEVL